MKRIGNIFDIVCLPENLHLAYMKAKKGKGKQYGVKVFEKHLDANLKQLRSELTTETYQTSEYSTFTIYDPKERTVYRLPFRDRVVHHAIMNVLEPIWRSVFITNTYACIKGRGIHAVTKHLHRDMHDVVETSFCLQLDIKKFYPSIDHDIMKSIIRKKIKDVRLIRLLDGVIDSAPGVPIGNYLSQFFANLYLSYFDHWIKEVKQVRYYYRYADDIVVLASNKRYLHELFDEITAYISERLKLQIKSDYQIFPVAARGIDFVGYVFYHTHTLMRKTIKCRMCRKAARLRKKNIEQKDFMHRMASHLGWAKYCNSKHLLKKVIYNETIL